MPFGFWGSSAPEAPQFPPGSGYKPTYIIPYRQPRTNAEAQALYNHIRTVALMLDSLSRSIPLEALRSLPPALDIGLEAIIGFFLPVVGDVIGLVFGLYVVFCAWLFGDLTYWTLGSMLLNVFVDAVIGLVPFIGDALDVAFKSNVRNLTLLESHLKRRAKKGGLVVQLAPPYEEEFRRAPPAAGRRGGRATPDGRAASEGLNWETISTLLNLVSVGRGDARRS